MIESLRLRGVLRALFIFGNCVALAFTEPLFTSVDVFTAGTEGYHTFRIPRLLRRRTGR